MPRSVVGVEVSVTRVATDVGAISISISDRLNDVCFWCRGVLKEAPGWWRYLTVMTSDGPVPVGWGNGCTLETGCWPRLTPAMITPTELEPSIWNATARVWLPLLVLSGRCWRRHHTWTRGWLRGKGCCCWCWFPASRFACFSALYRRPNMAFCMSR